MMTADGRSRFALQLASRIKEHALPTYSVLVPFYQEANVVCDIVEALSALDYPSTKLEIFLILETVDVETRAAVEALTLPENITVIVEPDEEPRTKPAALNYALRYASGECLVVFDAEDVPDPLQPRQAAAVLESDTHIGCVQACLNVYNARESFLTRGIMAQTPLEMNPFCT